ncbi:ROK family protein [Nonomuraea sp. NPDC049028]|uniref:ROK family protein n=1 Tax=Nonomuraea sp. NPDC049028 TaxID=3364348 RepID=UPI003715862C
MLDLLKPPHGPKEETQLSIVKALMARPYLRADLARPTGRVANTISTAIDELRGRNIIAPAKRGSREDIRLMPLTGVAVGVELGYQHMVVAARLAHQSFDEAETEFLENGAAQGRESWLPALVSAIRKVVIKVGGGPNELATIGMGIPRVVDPQQQTLVPPVLPPWQEGENPAAALTKQLARAKDMSVPANLRVRLDNDANLGAYAEHVYTHPHLETLIYIKASTGVGAGIIIGGKLFRGAKGCAGEIGHTMVQPDGRFCLCGGRGCLETLVGADAMLRDAQAMLGDKIFTRPFSVNQLVDQAEAGNPICRRIVRDAATLLGQSIGNVCNLLNPNVIVLGGVFGRAGDLAIKACNEGISRTAMAAAQSERPLVVATESPRATAHGALLLGIDGEGRA